MHVLVVGSTEPAAALTAALAERGLDAELHAPPNGQDGAGTAPLAGELVELERRLEARRPGVAVAVGVGDGPVALAITAAKLGVPLAAWLGARDAPDERAAAEGRILSTLAELMLDGEAVAAAERIAAWTGRDDT